MLTRPSATRLALALLAASTAGLAAWLLTRADAQPLAVALSAVLLGLTWLVKLGLDAQQSELQRLTQELQATDRELKLAAKRAATQLQQQRLNGVERLAGSIAHDFNNMLTVVGASTSMAERALASGSSPLADLHEVHVTVERGSELTKKLLAFAGRQVLNRRLLDLNDLVSSVERMLRRSLGPKTVLVTELSSEALRVVADAAQLEQVIVNLVHNARDAITAHGRIEISTLRELVPADGATEPDLPPGAYACLIVKDDGVGMTEGVQKRLFEPFFSTKPAGRATGLGLATSFGIVRQHEGAIRFESRPGAGTTMRVLFPLASAKAALATDTEARQQSRRKGRVLLVEDEPQVRHVAARVLTAAGFEVEQAANGAIGLALLSERPGSFDVVVTDVMMPALSGPDLARAACTLDGKLGLVFMSGFPEAMHDARASEFENAAFLVKPFAPAALVAAVNECIDYREAGQRRGRAATEA